MRDFRVKKGVHFLGWCRLRGLKDCWLELLQESLNCKIIDAKILYTHVHLYGDVH
jgi:hypothetical protein